MNPVWSPDDRMIVYEGAQSGPWQTLGAVAPDGGHVDLPEHIEVPALGESVRFLPDGSGMIYLSGVDPYYELRLLEFESGRSRPLTRFASSSTMCTFDITPDGETIVFDRERDNSDLVLIERRETK